MADIRGRVLGAPVRAARTAVRRYPCPVTTPDKPSSVRPVEYKGELLDAERGPGLGCFWTQLILLVACIVLTPLTVAWNLPSWVSIVMLFLTIVLLLFAGQTVIFLLRLVASDRREGRRVPLAGATPTVGELEDSLPAEAGRDAGADAGLADADARPDEPVPSTSAPAAPADEPGPGGVRE
jgi:hypothetical protein